MIGHVFIVRSLRVEEKRFKYSYAQIYTKKKRHKQIIKSYMQMSENTKRNINFLISHIAKNEGVTTWGALLKQR